MSTFISFHSVEAAVDSRRVQLLQRGHHAGQGLPVLEVSGDGAVLEVQTGEMRQSGEGRHTVEGRKTILREPQLA